MPAARASKKGVLLDIHVVPSSRDESIRVVDGVLKVKVGEPPDKGKANKAVLRVLKPHFGACEIVSGQSSKKKTVLVQNMGLDEVNAALEGLADG